MMVLDNVNDGNDDDGANNKLDDDDDDDAMIGLVDGNADKEL